MADLSRVPLEELRSRFVSLGTQLSTISEERREILAEIESRVRRVAAQFKVEALAEDDKRILREVLDTTVASPESVAEVAKGVVEP